MSYEEDAFPLIKEDTAEQIMTVKWQVGSSKYEIYTPLLRDLELSVLLPHCVEIKSKIDSAVPTVTHRGQSYFRVFPRTLSNVLLIIWTQILADNPRTEDEEGFTDTLMDFNCNE